MSSTGSPPARRTATATDPRLYGPVRHRRTTDTVVEQLERMILERRLQPGDSLPPERELALALSVSRNVLREALGVLGQKGLVRVAAGRGTTVVRPSTEHVEDALTALITYDEITLVELCDARLLIEPEFAASAAAAVRLSVTLRTARDFVICALRYSYCRGISAVAGAGGRTEEQLLAVLEGHLA